MPNDPPPNWRDEDVAAGAWHRSQALLKRLRDAHSPVAAEMSRLAEFAFSREASRESASRWSGSEVRAGLHARVRASAVPHVRHEGFSRVLAGIRNLLVLAPIALTWYGLGIAADAYATCRPDPEKVSREDAVRASGAPVTTDYRNALVRIPFLKLWENGFEGDDVVCDVQHLAEADWLRLGLHRFGEVVNADLKILVVIAGTTTGLLFVSASLDKRRRTWFEQTAPEIDWLVDRAIQRAHVVARGRPGAAAGRTVKPPPHLGPDDKTRQTLTTTSASMSGESG